MPLRFCILHNAIFSNESWGKLVFFVKVAIKGKIKVKIFFPTVFYFWIIKNSGSIEFWKIWLWFYCVDPTGLVVVYASGMLILKNN